MRAVEVRLSRNLVRESARRCCWLGGENVKPCAQAPRPHRVNERGLIHDFAARGVDEDCAFLHRVENVRADERARFGFQSEMHTDNIGDARDRLRSIKTLDAEFGGTFRCETATPCDDRHAESACTRNHLLTDLASADQTERAT